MKEICYKITDRKYQSYAGCQWGENVEHRTRGGPRINGWLHAFTHPLLAALLYPLYINTPPESQVLWKCVGSGRKNSDHGLKVGYTRLKTINKITMPKITREQRVRFAILCAVGKTKDLNWKKWAMQWLDGSDRSKNSAAFAASVASVAASASGSYAAATYAASAAASTVFAASYSAAAAFAAVYVLDGDLDLISIAKQAIKEEPA